MFEVWRLFRLPPRTEKCSATLGGPGLLRPCFKKRASYTEARPSVRQKTSWQEVYWQRSWIVPDDLRPTPQRRCKEATATAGPCSSRAGVLRSETAATSASRRRPSQRLSWLLLVGNELRVRGAPRPRIVESPAHRHRQPRPLGLTVAGTTFPSGPDFSREVFVRGSLLTSL